MIKNPGSNNSGTSLCPGEIYPSEIGIGFGRTPESPGPHFVNWVYSIPAGLNYPTRFLFEGRMGADQDQGFLQDTATSL